jgi:hypothetical protein
MHLELAVAPVAALFVVRSNVVFAGNRPKGPETVAK